MARHGASMLTIQDKHNPGCQRVARLKVSLAQGMIWEGAVKATWLIIYVTSFLIFHTKVTVIELT